MTTNTSEGVILPTITQPTLLPPLGYQIIPPQVTAFLGNDYPSQDVVEHLLDLFFKHCATVSPIADIYGFRKNVRNKTCSLFTLYCFMAAAAR